MCPLVSGPRLQLYQKGKLLFGKFMESWMTDLEAGFFLQPQFPSYEDKNNL